MMIPGEALLFAAIEYASFFLMTAGAAMILVGGVVAVIEIIQREALKRSIQYQEIRRDFTGKIIFGLEFLIAADVLCTVIRPTLDEIAVLGSIVVIRTLLGYFLQKELKEFPL